MLKGDFLQVKILVIYSKESKDEVVALREDIAREFGEASVLRLYSSERKKTLIKHAWHKDAIKMMKLADLIVYAISDISHMNKNVQWELKKAIKLKKHIVCMPVGKGKNYTLNDFLYETDKNTKETTCLVEWIDSKEELFGIVENYNNNAYLKLFHNEVDIPILLEQYKIFSQTAENLVERRQNVNSFYITANTALVSVGCTIFVIGDEHNIIPKIFVICALSLPGLLLNYSWHRMLQSYYINNQGKLKVLSMIEQKLAASLYDAEWKAMKNRYSKRKYVSFTDNEKKLPLVFGLFYLITIIVSIFVLMYL